LRRSARRARPGTERPQARSRSAGAPPGTRDGRSAVGGSARDLVEA
jgi:hypothetical protein